MTTIFTMWPDRAPCLEVVTVKQETAKALLVTDERRTATAWIPKSALKFDTRPTYEDHCIVAPWFRGKATCRQQNALGW